MAKACVRLLISHQFKYYYSSLLRTKLTLNQLSTHQIRLTHSDGDQRDIEKLFINDEVQGILKRLTGFDVNKVFAPRPIDPVRSPKYRFMTEEDYKLELEAAVNRGERKLQMPPVKAPWKDETEILSKDPELQGAINNKFIFVDASPGYSNSEKFIVVRETNGILRKANQDERHRMNYIFNKVDRREYEHPKMFQPEHLETILDQNEYQYILDRAALQFEPDDPEYIRVTHTTYDHINVNDQFDVLRSTRHFGPMAFYLAFNKRIDKLLLDCLLRELINDASDLIRLYFILNPKDNYLNLSQPIEVVKFYVANESMEHKATLELAIQKYEQIQKEKQQLQDDIKKAHGLSK